MGALESKSRKKTDDRLLEDGRSTKSGSSMSQATIAIIAMLAIVIVLLLVAVAGAWTGAGLLLTRTSVSASSTESLSVSAFGGVANDTVHYYAGSLFRQDDGASCGSQYVYNLICSGTLVDIPGWPSRRVVITAGHCIKDNAQFTRERGYMSFDAIPGYGALDPCGGRPDLGLNFTRLFRVVGAWVNGNPAVSQPDYFQHDWGILLLDRPVPSYVVPVPATMAVSNSPTDLTTQILPSVGVAGYGIVSQQNSVSKVQGPRNRMYVSLPVTQIQSDSITVDNSLGQGLCYGDSGSGAVTLTNSPPWILYGTFSGVQVLCGGWGFFMRTDTPAYRTWLNSVKSQVIAQAAAFSYPLPSLTPPEPTPSPAAVATDRLNQLYNYSYRSWYCSDRGIGSATCASYGDRSMYTAGPLTFANMWPHGHPNSDVDVLANIRLFWTGIDQSQLDPEDVRVALTHLPIDPAWPLQPLDPTLYAPRNTTCTRALDFVNVMQNDALVQFLYYTTAGWDTQLEPAGVQNSLAIYDNVTFNGFLSMFDSLAQWIDQAVQGDLYGAIKAANPGLFVTPDMYRNMLAQYVMIQRGCDSLDTTGMYNFWNRSYDPNTGYPGLLVQGRKLRGFVPTVAQNQLYLSKIAMLKPYVDRWISYARVNMPVRPADVNVAMPSTYWVSLDWFFGYNRLTTCPVDLFKSEVYPFQRDGNAIINWINNEYNANLTRLQTMGTALFGKQYTLATTYKYIKNTNPGQVLPGSTEPLVYPNDFCSSGQAYATNAKLNSYNISRYTSQLTRKTYGKPVIQNEFSTPQMRQECDTLNNAYVVASLSPPDSLDVPIYSDGTLNMGALPQLIFDPLMVMTHETAHVNHIFHRHFDVDAAEYRMHRPDVTAKANTRILDGLRQATEGLAVYVESDMLPYKTDMLKDPTSRFASLWFYYEVRLLNSLEWLNVNLNGWTATDTANLLATYPGIPRSNPALRVQRWKNSIPSGTLKWYVTGMYRWRRLQGVAQAACGAAYDARALYSNAVDIGFRSMDVTEQFIMNRYVNAGCPSDFGL